MIRDAGPDDVEGSWRRVVGRASAVVDARDHGARGDGSTDDREAIQRCIDLVSARDGGGTVHLPAGRYVIRGNLSMKDRVRLLGDGPGRTCVHAIDANWTAALPGAPTCPVDVGGPNAMVAIDVTLRIRAEGVPDVYEIVRDVTIEGIELHAGSGTGIRAKKVERFTIRDVVSHSSGGYGIGIEYFDDIAESRDVRLERVVVHHNRLDGIDIKRASNVRLENVIAHGNGRYGIDVRGSHFFADTISAYGNRWSGIVFSCHSNSDHPTRSVARNLTAYANGFHEASVWPDEDPEHGCDENLRDGVSMYDNFRVSPSQIALSSVLVHGNARHGVSIQHFDQYVSLTGVVAADNGQCGIAICGSNHHVTIASSQLERNGASGIALLAPSSEPALNAATSLTISAVHAHENREHGLYVEPDATDAAVGYDVTAIGCSFGSNVRSGVDAANGRSAIGRSEGLTLVGCAMMGNGARAFDDHGEDRRHLVSYCRAPTGPDGVRRAGPSALHERGGR